MLNFFRNKKPKPIAAIHLSVLFKPYLLTWQNCQLFLAAIDKTPNLEGDILSLNQNLKQAGITIDPDKTSYNEFKGFEIYCTPSAEHILNNLLKPAQDRIHSMGVDYQFLLSIKHLDRLLTDEKLSPVEILQQQDIYLSISNKIFSAFAKAKNDKECFSQIKKILAVESVPDKFKILRSNCNPVLMAELESYESAFQQNKLRLTS